MSDSESDKDGQSSHLSSEENMDFSDQCDSDGDMDTGAGVGHSEPTIGIDLGTTYCCVAVFRDGKTNVIANENGNRTTPSIVSYSGNERLVGDAAEMESVLDPANSICNSKRFIGRLFDDPIVVENKSKYPFKFKEQNKKVIFEVFHREEIMNVTPEEVGAALLGKMKKIAEDYLGVKVKKAVITVPAYFNDSQRRATKHAGTIAGLNVLRIINEPTAAAMAYGLHNKFKCANNNVKTGDKNILVFDLGGGTMDVSLLNFDECGVVEVKASSGNSFLGGEDFTRRLYHYFSREIFMSHNFDVSSLPRVNKRLLRACEKAKKELSSPLIKEVKVELARLIPGNQTFVMEISRGKFEGMCADLFQSTMETVKKVIHDASISKDSIEEVVLIGGSTRIPKVRELIKSMFPKANLNVSINPDEAVACGAAIQAAIVGGDDHTSLEDVVLLDVTPLSIGVTLKGEVTSVVIPRNTIIPVKRKKRFRTCANFQTEVDVEIVQGNN